MDLRTELAAAQMESAERAISERTTERFEKLDRKLTERKEREIWNIRNRFHREERKLAVKYRSDKRADVVRLHLDRDKSFHFARTQYDCFKAVQRRGAHEPELSCPTWLTSPRVPRYVVPNRCTEKMCLRVQARHFRKLLELDRDLKEIRQTLEESKACSLLRRKERPQTPVSPEQSDSIPRSRVRVGVFSYIFQLR